MKHDIKRMAIASIMAIILLSCGSEVKEMNMYPQITQSAVSDTIPNKRDTVAIQVGSEMYEQNSTPITKNNFENAYYELNQMLEGKQPQDQKKAVFLVENAWYDGALSYESYCNQINEIVMVLQGMVQAKGIEQYRTAGNWAAHTYLCKPIPENGNAPYIYDFDDPGIRITQKLSSPSC